MKKLPLPVFLFLTVLFWGDINAGAYNPEGFDKFVNYIQAMGRRAEVSETTLHEAFRNVKFDYKVVVKDIKQPERRKRPGFQRYKKKMVTVKRVNTAKTELAENYQLLKQVENRFGVEKEFIVAFWAIESGFGHSMGKHDIITALVSLAYEGRRRQFFQDELIYALKILDQKHIDRDRFKGSWAGAFGQVQFMPSTFLNHAYDFNGDGRKDIWYDNGDAFASAANYLHNIGWKYGEGWGKKVIIPNNLEGSYFGLDFQQPVYKWKQLGIKFADGSALPDSIVNASVIDPDGEFGDKKEVYMVYDNFRKIMEWNKSLYFATSISLIADKLK